MDLNRIQQLAFAVWDEANKNADKVADLHFCTSIGSLGESIYRLSTRVFYEAYGHRGTGDKNTDEVEDALVRMVSELETMKIDFRFAEITCLVPGSEKSLLKESAKFLEKVRASLQYANGLLSNVSQKFK